MSGDGIVFREEARRHYLRAVPGGGVVQVAPVWTWALLWLVLAALAALLLAALFGSVEVNARATAILRPSGGLRVLTSQVAGTVETVQARSGQTLGEGSVVLTIAAPALQGELLEAERQLQTLQSDFAAVSQRQDGLHREQTAQLEARAARLDEQIASQKESLAGYERKLRAYETLSGSGTVSQLAVIDAGEALARERRQLSVLQQSLAQTRQELSADAARRTEQLWQDSQALNQAQLRRDALKLSAAQTVITAPEQGVVEALLVKPGDAVQPGQPVGKLIPQEAQIKVVSFLAEKDRAFVKVGDAVRLELDQLPYGEFGTVGARVVRISDDLASPYEIEQALGAERRIEGSTYRIELGLTDTTAADRAGLRLTSGMLMDARYTLRRQRPITLVLEPLRRWLE